MLECLPGLNVYHKNHHHFHFHSTNSYLQTKKGINERRGICLKKKVDIEDDQNNVYFAQFKMLASCSRAIQN